MTDHDIADACATYGAKAVSDAVYRRMNGDRKALSAVGLPDVQSLGEAHRVTVVAFRLFGAADAAADLADAAISAARLPD